MPDTRPITGAETGAKPHNPPTSCGITPHHEDNMRKPPACCNGSPPFRYRHLAASPVPAVPSLTRFCPAILQRHRHDIIPVSCGQLREQRAFSLYRQPLAPPARQTGLSTAPSHPRTLAPSHPASRIPHPASRFPLPASRFPLPAFRTQKKPPVRCRNGRFGETAVSAGVRIAIRTCN